MESMQIISSVFDHQGMMPAKYTCEGADVSPPLSWSGIPPNAKSLVLIMDDPDAPDPAAPRMTWVHWVLYDIPPTLTGLAEGAAQHLPPGIREAMNDFRRTRYGGPVRRQANTATFSSSTPWTRCWGLASRKPGPC